MATQILPQTLSQDNRRIDIIFWFVAIAVILIGAGSFALSFNALLALATDNGIPAHLAWIWPLVVDLSLVIYAASILTFQLMRVRPVYPVLLTGFYGITTIAGNLLHSPANPVAWFVAALPPISLLLATELLRELAKQRLDRLEASETLSELTAQATGLKAEIGRLEARRDKLSEQVDELKQSGKRSYTDIADTTKEAALEILRNDPTISGTELGEMLERSGSTGRRLKRELLSLVNANGHSAGH